MTKILGGDSHSSFLLIKDKNSLSFPLSPFLTIPIQEDDHHDTAHVRQNHNSTGDFLWTKLCFLSDCCVSLFGLYVYCLRSFLFIICLYASIFVHIVHALYNIASCITCLNFFKHTQSSRLGGLVYANVFLSG